MNRRPPVMDGTAATDEFTCPACRGRHPRLLRDDDDDGIVGGQGRTPDTLRDGYVLFSLAIVGILCIVAVAVAVSVMR